MRPLIGQRGRGEALAGVLLVTAGCSASIANRDSRGSAIICFGDSLTAGVGANTAHDYPSLLARALGEEVINAGVSGETTTDGLARLEADVLSRDPRLVIVEFGGNDFLRHVPRAEIFSNLDQIVARIQARGAMVVVLGVKPGLFFDETRQDYERIARARQAAFIPDILGGILTEPSLKSDELHPNDAGYEKMAERVARLVKPLLEKRERN